MAPVVKETRSFIEVKYFDPATGHYGCPWITLETDPTTKSILDFHVEFVDIEKGDESDDSYPP